jgi:hypothetical protein
MRENQNDQSQILELLNGSSEITIKRCHGLGNLVCLLPVLHKLRSKGLRVRVVTRPEWMRTFSIVEPSFEWTDISKGPIIDLDRLTMDGFPREHRTSEFGRLLGETPPYPVAKLELPKSLESRFGVYKDCIILAPEAGHPSRQWPMRNWLNLGDFLREDKIILVGNARNGQIPCFSDLRGELELVDLFVILSCSRAVISMDSGVLHISASLGVPTVALFGGINPKYRIRSSQKVLAIQADLECCPCNKDEKCANQFPCISSIQIEQIVRATEAVKRVKRRVIWRVPA